MDCSPGFGGKPGLWAQPSHSFYLEYLCQVDIEWGAGSK